MLVKRINLEVDREYYVPILAQQWDSARSLEFAISSNGLQIDLTNISIKLIAIKPDNTKIYNNLTVSNNIATLNLTTQLLAVVGKVKCQLQLVKDSKILRTIIFYIEVKESLDIENAIESTDEFTALESAIQTLNEWNSYFTQNSGKIEEKYTTRLNTVEGNITALQTNIATNTTNIASNTQSIESITDNISTLQASVNTNIQDINTLKSKTNTTTSTVTIATGNAVLTEGYVNRVIKRENEVTIDISVRYKTKGSNSLLPSLTLFTLPEGFRPARAVKKPVLLGRAGDNSHTVGVIDIATNGVVTATPYDGLDSFYSVYCNHISFSID